MYVKALLRGCLHNVHARYFFNPLFSEGMKIETLCSKRVVVLLTLVSKSGILVILNPKPSSDDVIVAY